MVGRVFSVLLVLLLPNAAADEFREAFVSVTPANFDDGGPISRQFHLNAESYLPMTAITRVEEPRELRVATEPKISDLLLSLDGDLIRLTDYVAQEPLLDGVIILKGEEVLFESYSNMQAWQRHFSWSVTKVVTSTGLAALVDRGLVDMQAPVERYVTELVGTAWEGIPVQNIADMASGIDCRDSDGYQDTSTCVYTMEETLGITESTGRELGFLEHLQNMQRLRPAGKLNEYVSANTNVLMLVMEEVTGKSYTDILQELVWDPIGAESDALMAISREGYAYASGGLHARLRDIARFGLVFTRPEDVGVLSNQAVEAMQTEGVPIATDMKSRLSTLFGDDVPERASWQWDLVWADGAMYKGGYLGQGLYVDPDRDLIVAWFGTGLNYSAENNQFLPISRQISSAMIDLGRQTESR
ncbi:MAG: serine hydrolase domain-containing protein [Pseudomonadota bacterium]